MISYYRITMLVKKNMNPILIEEREENIKCCESSMFSALASATVGVGGPRDYVSGPVDRCLSAQTPYQGCL